MEKTCAGGGRAGEVRPAPCGTGKKFTVETTTVSAHRRFLALFFRKNEKEKFLDPVLGLHEVESKRERGERLPVQGGRSLAGGLRRGRDRASGVGEEVPCGGRRSARAPNEG